MNIFERPVEWNSHRYDRVYNHELACALLVEECDEFVEAHTEVDSLDALCDIFFVGIGILWKLNYDPTEYLTKKQPLVVNRNTHPADLISYVEKFNTVKDESTRAKYCAKTIQTALALMYNMGLTWDQIESAIHVVCDSNDSKLIQKTEPGIKANQEKGESFVAPEPKLQEILDARR